MSLVRNKKTRRWESYIRDRVLGRIHLSMRTKRKAEAATREAALMQLLREGHKGLIEDLRNQRLNIEQIERVARERKPFEELNQRLQWPTFGQACDAYLDSLAQNPNRAANTVTQARHYLSNARSCFGDRKGPEGAWLGRGTLVNELTEADAARFLAGFRDRGLSNRSVALAAQRLSALFNWLIRQEQRQAAVEKRTARVLHNPVDRERIPTPTSPRTRFLSRDEAKRLLEAAPEWMRFPILAGMLAGLRIGEVVNLRTTRDVDLDNRLLIIQDHPDWKPKSVKSRRKIPIPDEFLPYVKAHVEQYASVDWMLPSGIDNAAHLSQHALTTQFRRVVCEAGLVAGRTDPDGVTFHTLRHTFASWLVMEGTDLFTVAALMGHSSTALIEQTYAHLSPDHTRHAAGRVATWLTSGNQVFSMDTVPDETAPV